MFTFYVVPECEHWCHLVLLPVYAIQTLSYEIHFADFGGLPWLLSAFPWRRQTVGGEVWPPHLWSAEAPSTHCVSEYMSQLWPKWIKKKQVNTSKHLQMFHFNAFFWHYNHLSVSIVNKNWMLNIMKYRNSHWAFDFNEFLTFASSTFCLNFGILDSSCCRHFCICCKSCPQISGKLSYNTYKQLKSKRCSHY